MSTTLAGIVVIGILALVNIPVSLMPKVDIPTLTVQLKQPNASARQLDDNFVKPLHRQFLELTHLADIQCETRSEISTIKVQFEYGTNMEYALFEVNEKIDLAMAQLSREYARPTVIASNPSDIPVFYINIALKDSLLDKTGRYVELSSLVRQYIRKRLEQMPEIAFVDMNGLADGEIVIVPNIAKLDALNISIEDFEAIIRSSNADFGSMIVQDGEYQYNVNFNAILKDKSSIEELYFKKDSRLLQIKDIASVQERLRESTGFVLSEGRRSISLAVIRQEDAQIHKMEASLHAMVENFRRDYPDVYFKISRDQTELLKLSISNLNQDLLWGTVIAIAVMAFFLKDFISPTLISLTIPISIILCVISFYVLDISINIISLSGLVLGIGMMIDNSIIVIDNIVQHRERGIGLNEACSIGAQEVFLPMLSSSLTTCAVFIPLIYISGISGALFYDEALAVSIGAVISLLVSVTIVPVYYSVFQGIRMKLVLKKNRFVEKPKHSHLALYEKSFAYLFRHQRLLFSIVLAVCLLGVSVYTFLPKSKLPELTRDEFVLNIDWNEPISVDKNYERVVALLDTLDKDVVQTYSAYVGQQQFLLDLSRQGTSEVSIYFKLNDPKRLASFQKILSKRIRQLHTDAIVSLTEASNIFNTIFPDLEPPLVIKVRPSTAMEEQTAAAQTAQLIAELKKSLTGIDVSPVAWRNNLLLQPDLQKLILYEVSYDGFYSVLKKALTDNSITVIERGQEILPVVRGNTSTPTIQQVLRSASIENSNGKLFPLDFFVSEVNGRELKTVYQDKAGEFYPVPIIAAPGSIESVIDDVQSVDDRNDQLYFDYSGSYFSNQRLIQELSLVLIISTCLLYLILAAQFESLVLPLIILLEIPIAISGAFILLLMFGTGINVMSLIGIVIMGGIIINDSILKIDAIRQLQAQGCSLMRSIFLGSHRRFKSILMTSLTTTLAMVPLLFTPGMGAELQKPLAIALGGGMAIGTLVSLYFIPICYYHFQRKR